MRLIPLGMALVILMMTTAFSSQRGPTLGVPVGWVEKVTLPKLKKKYDAKLDTGATTSSIHAEIITKINEKNTEIGEKIKFALISDKGERTVIKRPLVRWARIKSREGDGKFHSRPVVDMTFCLAGATIRGEVNLTDRDHFNYAVLIGRNMLADAHLVVDSTQTYTKQPKCEE